MSSPDFASPEALSTHRLGWVSVCEIVWWVQDTHGPGLHFPYILTAVRVTGQYLRHLLTDKIAMFLFMAACTHVCVLCVSVYTRIYRKNTACKWLYKQTHIHLKTQYYKHIHTQKHNSLVYSPEPLQIFISEEHDQQQNQKRIGKKWKEMKMK